MVLRVVKTAVFVGRRPNQKCTSQFKLAKLRNTQDGSSKEAFASLGVTRPIHCLGCALATQDSGAGSRRFPAIYTRTGDGGTSATFTGERRPKDDAVFEALGTIDELSAVIGLARALSRDAERGYVSRLKELQCALQDVGSLVATPRSSARQPHVRRVGDAVPAQWTDQLEAWVDEYTEELPPLDRFILPGGGVTGATLHLARTVCRRAERCVVPLARAGEVHPSVVVYLNRLSDLLFTVARVAAKEDGGSEEIYVRPKPIPAAENDETI